MSYDYDYDAPARGSSRRQQYRDDRRDDRGYADEGYLSPRAQTSSRDLVPRHREDSDLSVEEVPRHFPPPGYGGRARSADPGYYDDYDDRRSQYSGRGDHDRGGHGGHHHRSQKKGGTSLYYEEEERKRARVLGKQEKIIAALAGAALAVGGKELFDRREAHQEGSDIHRNPLTSAALGAAGALAGYQGAEFYNKRAGKEEKKSTYMLHHSSDGRVAEAYYSDDEEVGGKEKKGHKNFLESAVAAAGLGTAFKALTGGHDDKHSDSSSRRGSRSGGKEGGGAHKIQQAAMASLIAGATEAFRVAKEPGGWKGEKAKRILTVAAGAASVDAVSGDKHPKLALAESVIAGLGLNRALNGSRKNIEEDRTTGRSRSRSRARSGSGGGGGATGLAALATAGLGALGAKKLMDNNRDRSRSRQRSQDSDRSGSPDKRRRSRSRSVVDTGRRALAKLGIGSDPDGDRRRDDDDGGSSRGGGGRSRKHGSDDGHDDRRRGGGGGRDDYDDDARSHNGGGGGRSRNRSRSGSRQRGGQSGSDTDLGDSDEDEKRGKKMRGKQILTTGLAAVATIHAAHNVYQSMEKRNARHKAVKEGRLSEEEAKKLKTKALLQDAASVGIAALGIKGALSELKEAREMSHECKEWQEEKEKRHAKRLQRQKGGGHKAIGDRDHSHDHDDGGGYGDHDGYDDRYYDGPRYPDGNPYAAALPAPPVGYYDDRR